MHQGGEESPRAAVVLWRMQDQMRGAQGRHQDFPLRNQGSLHVQMVGISASTPGQWRAQAAARLTQPSRAYGPAPRLSGSDSTLSRPQVPEQRAWPIQARLAQVRGRARTWKLPEQPALLIQTSMEPSCAAADSTSRCTLDGLATSQSTPATHTSGLTCAQRARAADSARLQELLHAERAGHIASVPATHTSALTCAQLIRALPSADPASRRWCPHSHPDLAIRGSLLHMPGTAQTGTSPHACRLRPELVTGSSRPTENPGASYRMRRRSTKQKQQQITLRHSGSRSFGQLLTG